MPLGDKHPKKDVEAALKRAEKVGLKVTRKQNGHNWGALVCCPCTQFVRISCTPRSNGDEANKIDKFTNTHRTCA